MAKSHLKRVSPLTIIGLSHDNTIETYLKRVLNGDCEQWKKETCRFAQDMSSVMHCRNKQSNSSINYTNLNHDRIVSH